MYWCSPLPVRRLQPAESYNSLSFSSLSWKGATTPYFFSWRIKWSTSIQQIQSTTDIRSVITETTQNTLWTKIYSQQIILRQGRIFSFCGLRLDAVYLLLFCVQTHCSSMLCCDRRTQQHYRAASFASETHPIILSRRVFRFRDAPETLLYCVSVHLLFTEPASLQI